jgi:hypothetical protein
MICDSVKGSYSLHCFSDESSRIVGYHVGWSDDMIRIVIQQHMKRLARYICPHMRSNDNYFQRMVLKGPVKRRGANMPDIHGFSGPTLLGIPSLRIRCPAEDCDTTFVIYRIESYINVCFVRLLGTLENALDPKWYAQLEHPSEEVEQSEGGVSASCTFGEA